KRLELIIQDNTGKLKGGWYKGGYYIKKRYSKGDPVAFFGQAEQHGRYVSIAHPEVDKSDNTSDIQNFGRIVPIYPGNKALSKARISSKLVLRWQKEILDKVKPPEFLPEELLQDHNLPLRRRAYRMIHLPESASEYQQA